MPTVAPTGIAATETVSSPVVTTSTSLSVAPTGIASTSAVGSHVVTNGILLSPTGIASNTRFGVPKVSRSTGATQTVAAQNIQFTMPLVGLTGSVPAAVPAPVTGTNTTDAFIVKFRASGYQPTAGNTASDSYKRGLLKTNITMPTPAIISGRPYLPQVWMKSDSSIAMTVGSSNIRAITPPVPVVTHPSGLPTQYTWTVEDLADPPGNHGFYDLTSWKEHAGGPAWKSSSTYAPRVADKVVYGSDNTYQTYSRSVHFDASSVEHMWIDLGTHSQPFTWVICGIINYYPNRTYGHYLLDAGKPTPSRDTSKDWKIDDGLTYRSLMLYQTSSAVLATHTGADAVANGKHITAPHDEIARPRVFVGVFNGASSWIGSYDTYHKYGKSGAIDTKTHRYFLLGRRQNNVSDNLASHMTLFEIRFFNQALTANERAAQYKQLASKWSFNKYGKGT